MSISWAHLAVLYCASITASAFKYYNFGTLHQLETFALCINCITMLASAQKIQRKGSKIGPEQIYTNFIVTSLSHFKRNKLHLAKRDWCKALLLNVSVLLKPPRESVNNKIQYNKYEEVQVSSYSSSFIPKYYYAFFILKPQENQLSYKHIICNIRKRSQHAIPHRS